MTTKFCPQCETTKLAAAFPNNASRSDGLGGWCRECMLVPVLKWKALNPERLRTHSRTWYEKNKVEVASGRV